ncbi:MAG: GNAT family N-acetyltransferase [Chloroflexi bacterium]|jgi:RimJ/RimL family protein N-acetyltransferase|nr:GNAT family N-acetyltransferase [Chloroflexota bacterium]
MNILETERLALRKLGLDDVGFILDLLNQPSFIQFIGDRGVRTLEQARAYILNGPIASYERFGFGLYAILLKDSGIPIGMCGLIKRAVLQDVDIGFAFLPQFWLKGYGFEAAAAVLAYGKSQLGLTRIVGVTQSDNQASIHLLKKLGLRYEKNVTLVEAGPELLLFSPAD